VVEFPRDIGVLRVRLPSVCTLAQPLRRTVALSSYSWLQYTGVQLLPRPVQVAADASTSSRPLEGFTPRRGAGLAIFGRSNVEPAAKPVSPLSACP